MIHHKAKFFSICGCAKLEDKLPDAKAQWWDRNGIRVIGISIPKREKMKGRKETAESLISPPAAHHSCSPNCRKERSVWNTIPGLWRQLNYLVPLGPQKFYYWYSRSNDNFFSSRCSSLEKELIFVSYWFFWCCGFLRDLKAWWSADQCTIMQTEVDDSR